MLRALLKKQAMEAVSLLLPKGGRGRSRGFLALYGLLMAYLAVVMGGMFTLTARTLCAPLAAAGLGWLYFALMGLTALTLGVFGSVFLAYAGLYQARDNELLLAMPIPPGKLLLARVSGVAATAYLMAALALAPAAAVYQVQMGFSPAALLGGVAVMLTLPLGATALSCLLGWVIALVAARVRHRSALVVALSLGGMGAYFWAITRLNQSLSLLLANSQAVGDGVRRALYPLYLLGRGMAGDLGAMVVTALGLLGVFALTLGVLSRGFVRLATARQAAPRRTYRAGRERQRSPGRALLGRELVRFWSSPTYLLNCGIGSIFLLIGGVAACVKATDLRVILAQIPALAGRGPLLACAAVGLLVFTAPVTAPSVSLEGRSLWVLQAMPVDPRRVLWAKLQLHLAVVGVPALVFAGCLCWALEAGALEGALTLALALGASLLAGEAGLAANLKLPNLTWTNETYPVKQGASVAVTLFGGWGLVAALGGVWLLVGQALGTAGFLALAAALVLGACLGLWAWLGRRGAEIFANLG